MELEVVCHPQGVWPSSPSLSYSYSLSTVLLSLWRPTLIPGTPRAPRPRQRECSSGSSSEEVRTAVCAAGSLPVRSASEGIAASVALGHRHTSIIAITAAHDALMPTRDTSIEVCR